MAVNDKFAAISEDLHPPPVFAKLNCRRQFDPIIVRNLESLQSEMAKTQDSVLFNLDFLTFPTLGASRFLASV